MFCFLFIIFVSIEFSVWVFNRGDVLIIGYKLLVKKIFRNRQNIFVDESNKLINLG